MEREKQLFSDRLIRAMLKCPDARNQNTKHGVDTAALQRTAGVSREMARRYLEGMAIPNPDPMRAIANWLGVRVAWLRDGEGPMSKGTSSVIQDNLSSAPPTRGMVPVISWVQAGALTEAVDIYAAGDGDEWLPCPQAHGPHTFALRVQGDSMTSPYPGQHSYPDGTIIYVDPDVALTNGRRVVAKLVDTNEATFKVYVEDAGRRFLRPINPQYPTIELNGNFAIVGVVIGSYMPE